MSAFFVSAWRLGECVARWRRVETRQSPLNFHPFAEESTQLLQHNLSYWTCDFNYSATSTRNWSTLLQQQLFYTPRSPLFLQVRTWSWWRAIWIRVRSSDLPGAYACRCLVATVTRAASPELEFLRPLKLGSPIICERLSHCIASTFSAAE